MAAPTIEQINETLDRVAQRQEETAKGLDALKSGLAVLKDYLDEVGKRLDEVGRYVKSVGEQVGEFTNNAGASNEELFFRNFQQSKQLGGEHYPEVGRNIRKNGRATEIDIILANGKRVAVIEVKNRARASDIEALLQSKIALAHALYPRCGEVYFGIASMIVDDELEQAAREAGIYLITQGGGHVEVVNDRVKAF